MVKQNFRMNNLTVGTVPNKKRNNSGETKFQDQQTNRGDLEEMILECVSFTV